MSRIFITGSAQGLGHIAATTLLDDGHQVVVHARSHQRAGAGATTRLVGPGHRIQTHPFERALVAVETAVAPDLHGRTSLRRQQLTPLGLITAV